MRNRAVASLLIIAIIAGAIAAYYIGSSHGSATTSVSTTTCTGYPPAGDCITTYSATFTISINYSGPWKLTYEGNDVSGNDTGRGFFSEGVTLSDLTTNWLRLCATAQKMDGSNDTLILTVTGHNETSLPYGATSYCGGAVP